MNADGPAAFGLRARQIRKSFGKSTLVKIIAGDDQADDGEIISLGRLPNRRGIVSLRAMYDRARQILDQLEVDIDPAVSVGTLRVGVSAAGG